MIDKESWIDDVVQSVMKNSRAALGISDTSSSPIKPQLRYQGPVLSTRTQINLHVAAKAAWYHREDQFQSAPDLRNFIDLLATIVLDRLLPDNQSLYRTWNTKYANQTKYQLIEGQYIEFCQWLWRSLDEDDIIPIAAMTEKRLDGDIHFLADGCGKTSKLLASYLLLRHNLPPATYDMYEEYYAKICSTDVVWKQYWRKMYEDNRVQTR